MVERIAEALRHECRGDRVALARKVLKAMREPTKPMIEYAAKNSFVYGENAMGVWCAMIDAAQEEE